jgi:thymidylate synthase (FAD)
MALTEQQLAEVAELREQEFSTRRACVPALEDELYKPIEVLDHGFVRVVDYMGDDSSIVQAARVSYGKGTKLVNQDRGLINYLMRHWHTTPFEMCEIKFHVKLPMFVARQWIRHRTANVNEYSARYSVLDKEFYIPNNAQLAPQSASNHQGRAEGESLQGEEAARVLDILKQDSSRCYDHYQEMMNEDSQGNVIDEDRQGLARELARMNLPINAYTQWYWKVDLHNLMHFLRLRADEHAQYEIRVYADEMCKLVQKWVPLAYEAFEDHRMNNMQLSGRGTNIVKAMVKGEIVSFRSHADGMSKREWNELMGTLEMNDLRA